MTMQDVGEGTGVFFDGSSSRKRQVALRLDSALDLIEDGAVVATWPFDDIRRADGPSGRLRLNCMSAPPLARLEIVDPAAIRALMARAPKLDADRGGPRQTARIVFWSIAAVCSILVIAIYGIPLAADRLAPLVPDALETRMGDAVDTQVRALFGSKVCNAAEGRAAFAAMVEKIRIASGIERPLNAQVLSSAIPNAFALPGGRVYVLDALLQKAQNPDEIAGVLAHELGHEHHRHTMRMLIQNGGSSFLVGLLLGDITGASAVIFGSRQLLQASHSREAEQEADEFAYATMRKLGRSPVPTAEMLLRITGEQGKRLSGFTILNSHPLTESRLAAAKKAVPDKLGPDLLSSTEWRALKAICKPE
jgi:predicted Zn-dependent protease